MQFYVFPAQKIVVYLLTLSVGFGGEAVSLAVNYTHAAQFRAAGYVPLTVDGVEYGEVRQYGNFSFTRIYEAGHQVPYYQPIRKFVIYHRGPRLTCIAKHLWRSSTGPSTATMSPTVA